MRQTIFFITLDRPFSWLSQGTPDHPILHIGIGLLFLIALGAVLGLRFVSQRFQGLKSTSEERVQFFKAAAQFAVIALLFALISPMREFPVRGYGTMLVLAFIAGAKWACVRSQKVGIPSQSIWDVSMLILISGIVGARLFYLIQYGHLVFAEVQTLPQYLFAIVNLSEGGLVLYGGIILGAVAYFTYCYVQKIHPLQLADVLTPSIFLGLGFGRLGCLLNGCCYGDYCSLPWAITFPVNSVPYIALLNMGFITPDATASLPLHPTQIYSSLGGFLFAGVTAVVFHHRRKVGEVLAVGALLYPVNRFLIEFLRGDEFTQFDTGFTISQLVSMGMFFVALAYIVWLEMFGKQPGSYSPKASAG